MNSSLHVEVSGYPGKLEPICILVEPNTATGGGQLKFAKAVLLSIK